METFDNSKDFKYSENVEKVAYSYIRWSTAIQSDGDSLRRQKHLAERWCERNGVTLADDRIMIDAGVSAFKGRNTKDGALSAFLAAAEEGKIARGSYLLIESFDRISRQGPMKTASIVQQLWQAGISIVTVADEPCKIFHPDCDNMDALNIVFIAMRAKEESETKAKRVKSSWEARTQKARTTGESITGNLPAWLSNNPVTKKPDVIDERKAEVVRHIYDLCISGYGLPKIAKTLNDGGVRPFAMDKKNSGRAEYWTVANVAYLLKSKAVFGEYHPPKSEPMLTHFPPIVSKDEFYRAQASMAGRLKFSKGNKGAAYTNLFQGIAKCHYCGEPMHIRNPKPGRALQFRCKAAAVGNCEAKPWNYEVFEKSFLSFVNEIDLEAIISGGSGSRSDEITREIQKLHGERLYTQKAQDAFIEMIQTTPKLAGSLASAMTANQDKLDANREQVAELETERNKLQVNQRTSAEINFVEFPVGIGKEDLYKLRAKTAEQIRTVVEQIALKRDPTSKYGSCFTVYFVGGGLRTVHVDYTNPRKPYAVNNGYGGKDIIPEDAGTAMEMLEYVSTDILQEAKWLIEADPENAKAIMNMVHELVDKLEGWGN